MIKQIFVNLPVKDLKRSMDFFGKLGFTFNPQFTNEKAASMLLGDNIYVMLLGEEFFKTFTNKNIADASQMTEVINAVSLASKIEVDEMTEKALEAGATKYKEADDYGWMYSRSFADLDGHLWELLYMDESKSPQSGANA